MFTCEFNSHHEMHKPHIGKPKTLLFPDGRRLDWRNVCGECLTIRADWQAQRDIEAFNEAERRRQWHKEVAERKAQRLASKEAFQRVRDLARLEALEIEVEQLRKKYF